MQQNFFASAAANSLPPDVALRASPFSQLDSRLVQFREQNEKNKLKKGLSQDLGQVGFKPRQLPDTRKKIAKAKNSSSQKKRALFRSSGKKTMAAKRQQGGFTVARLDFNKIDEEVDEVQRQLEMSFRESELTFCTSDTQV